MEQSIERRANLPYDEFVAEYFKPRRPVIITDAVKQWKALTWTPQMFRERFGDRVVTIEDKDYMIRDLIDAIESSTPQTPAPYLRSAILRKTFPELFTDIEPVHPYMANNWLRLLRPFVPGSFNVLMNDLAGPDLFIGAPGAKLRNLHQDVFNVESFITQFYGSKEFVFFSPDNTPYLYPQGGESRFRSQIRDPFEPADLTKYPLYAKAKRQRCTLEPGETLYVPCFWWHSSRVMTTSINGVFSVVNDRNWSDFVDDVATRVSDKKFWRWASRPVHYYLTGVGKVIGRTRRGEAAHRPVAYYSRPDKKQVQHKAAY